MLSLEYGLIYFTVWNEQRIIILFIGSFFTYLKEKFFWKGLVTSTSYFLFLCSHINVI